MKEDGPACAGILLALPLSLILWGAAIAAVKWAWGL